MYKFIKTSEGFGISSAPGSSSRSQVSVIEKMSEARSQQADWQSRVNRIDPRIREWIKTADLDHDRYTYAIVVPLGADESWEETVNGDAFERAHLEVENDQYGHKTFERFAKAFTHHRNSRPELGYGDHPLMVYNRESDRCEGVWRLDNEKSKKVGAWYVLDRIISGRPVEISMGTKVPYDVCSLCGNKAKTPAEYCSHVKRPGFGHIDPVSGEKMRVFNPFPRFFDLSAVVIPAAPEALVMGRLSPELVDAIQNVKLSSRHFPVVPSSVLGAEIWGFDEAGLDWGVQKASSKVSALKISDMIKEIPAMAVGVVSPLQEDEEEIDEDALEAANVKHSSLPAVLSTFAALGIPLTPGEFCDVMDATEGTGTKGCTLPADEIRRAFEFADPSPLVTSLAVRPEMASSLRYLVPRRTVLLPHLGQRIRNTDFAPKKARTSPRVEIRVQVSGVPMTEMYASYIKALCLKMGALLREVMQTNPDHLENNLLCRDLTVSPSDGSMEGAEKVSELAAQALLPALCLLGRAGQADRTDQVLRTVSSLNVPGVEPLVGGVIQ